MSNVIAPTPVPSSVVADSGYADSFRRQSSLSGEDIKIVIDDVDQLDLDQTSEFAGCGAGPSQSCRLDYTF